MTTISSPLGTWLNASAQVGTLNELKLLQDTSRLLAERVAGIDPQLAEQLQSSNHEVLGRALESLGRNPGLVQLLESHLDQEAATALVTAAIQFQTNEAAPRDRYVAETSAAAQSHSVLGYALGRLREVAGTESTPLAVGRIVSERLAGSSSSILALLGRAAGRVVGPTQERPATSKYDYDIEKTRGRMFTHEEAPLTATSEEGRAFYVQSRREELEKLKDFTAAQLALNSSEIQALYQQLRSQVIEHHKPVRQEWDRTVVAMRNLGNIPNFKTVSEAYWKRDQVIRGHSELRARNIGPREYDLLQQRSEYNAKEITGTATHRDRVKTYGGEFDYALGRITAEHAELSKTAETPERNQKLKALEYDRFRMERVFTNLAANKDISKDDSVFLDSIRPRYLPYLVPGLSGLDLRTIDEAQAHAQLAYDIYSRNMHERHVALTPMMLALFMEEQRRILEIDRLEREWQMARYKDLIGRRRVTPKDQKQFDDALADYQATYEEYLQYADKMANGDPKKREYERNAKYRNVFVSFWNLHDTVKEILGDNNLQMLTFAFKTQAQFLARGDQGMAGIEPIAEITGRLGQVLDHNEKTIYSLSDIRGLAGRDWSGGQLSHYVKDVHIIGAEKLIGYFAQDVRPETKILEGAARLYPDGFTEMKSTDFARRSGVRRALHLGQLEFAEAMGAFYMLGFGHVAILAQAGVGNFPVAGPFLYGLDRGGHHYLGSGAMLDRNGGGDQRTHEAFTREIQLGMGNNVNVYESGTRDIGSPLGSPYADFDEYPETVHLSEYHGTRYNTGMSLKLAQEMGVPVITVAYDLGKIYPEPSMPMPSNFKDNFGSKNPRRIANKLDKSYGGFYNKRTMLRYVRPGEDDMRIAYGDVMTPESFVTPNDLSRMLDQESYGSLAAIADEKARAKAMRWQVTLHNSAAANFYERAAGYMATAGIYGPNSRAQASNGHLPLRMGLQPATTLAN